MRKNGIYRRKDPNGSEYNEPLNSDDSSLLAIKVSPHSVEVVW